MNGTLGARDRTGHLVLFDGVMQGVQSLWQAGADVALWSSSKRVNIDRALRGHAFPEWAHVWSQADCVGRDRRKPYRVVSTWRGPDQPVAIVDNEQLKVVDWPSQCVFLTNDGTAFTRLLAWIYENVAEQPLAAIGA